MRAPRVAIVEDEVLIVLDLARSFQQAGFVVTAQAASGADAVHAIEQACASGERPDVVLMDVRLRGAMDGVEAAKHLRQTCGPDLAIIFVTGYGEPVTREGAAACGPVAIFGKPVRAEQVIEAARRALTGRGDLVLAANAALALKPSGPRPGSAPRGAAA